MISLDIMQFSQTVSGGCCTLSDFWLKNTLLVPHPSSFLHLSLKKKKKWYPYLKNACIVKKVSMLGPEKSSEF